MDENELVVEGLPAYLRNDILAWEAGLESGSHLLDCYFCELQSSINIAYYDNEITGEQADFLRSRVLGIRN